MLSPEPTAPELPVDNILAFSDAALVQYMKEHRGPDGGFDLPVEGWEKLSKDQRDTLAERLRAAALKANDNVQSRPVDPDQVAARLLEISDKDTSTQALSRPSRRERSSSTVEVDPDEMAKELETIAYNDLVNDGGRPSYPVCLIHQVSQNPEQYREVLQPWQEWPDTSPPWWEKVLRRQQKRWLDFRHWQEDNRDMVNEEDLFAAFFEEEKRKDTETKAKRRYPDMTKSQYLEMLKTEFKRRQTKKGIDDGEEGFSAFVEEERQRDLEIGRTWPGMTEDEYRQTLRSRFDRQQDLRYWQNFYWLREDHGRGGFPEYVEEAKRRLTRHGFTRPFQLDEDPKRQDKLTTWIEYLNYECSWYDLYTGHVERLQPKHDEAWEKLVDSKVLKPSETEEYLRSDESSFRRQSEEDAASKAVESARSAARAVLILTEKASNDPQCSRLTKPMRLQMIAKAQSRLDAAQESLRAIKRRGDLITEFICGQFDYRAAKRNVERHSILLRWIREQIPLIEAELKESEAAEGSSHAERGTKRRRLGAATSQGGEKSRRVRFDDHDGPRRSARIAARQDLSRTTAPPRAVKNPSQRDHRKRSQRHRRLHPLQGRKGDS